MMAFRCGRRAKSDISDTDDDDCDDDVFVDSVMQKAKTGSGGRLNPRRIWRSRSKSRVASLALWTPQGDGKWCNSSGNQVVLTDVNLLSLTEAEVAILRKIAIEKLKSSDLDCSVTAPKHTDPADNESKPKRRALMLRKRAVTTGSFQSTAFKDSGAVSGQGAVFGVPLAKCIPSRRDAESRNSSTSSGVLPARELEQLRSSSGSQSAEDISGDKGLLEKSRSLAGSQTSCNIPLDINGSERFLAKQSLNLDRKSCSMVGLSALDTCPQEWGAPPEVPTPLIPHVVSTCFEHIESFGLQSLGIFRISSSKKRIRQLREDFDTGKKMNLGKEHCPHDVATLLKEYFRDLPEPLLTRELYPAFVGTQRIRNRRQQLEILRFLIQLLPVPNRDTLWALLRFLGKVAVCANDYRCDTGEIVAGNKMDSNNLATLFGPNILHTAKSCGTGSEKTFQVESTKRAEERIDVIKVVRSMIDNYQELFEVTASELDEVYQRMMDVNAVTLAQLLQSRLPSSELELDQDTGSSACEGSDSASLTQLPIDVTLEVISLDSSRTPESTHRSSSQESLSSRLFRRREKSMAWGMDDEGLYWTRRKNDKPGSGSGSRSGSRSGSAEDISYKALSVDASSRWFKKRTDKGKKTPEQEARGAFARPLRLCTEDIMRPQVSVVDIRKEQLPGGTCSGRKQSSTAATDSPIISASLTIKVPLSRSQTGPALAFGLGRDTDIPYIEDNQSESASIPSEHRHFFSSKEKLVQKRSGGGSEDEDRRHKSSQCVKDDASKAACKGPRRSRDSFGKSASSRSSPTSQGSSSSSAVRRQQVASGDTAQRSPGSSFRWSGHGDTWKRWEIIASEHTEQETVV